MEEVKKSPVPDAGRGDKRAVPEELFDRDILGALSQIHKRGQRLTLFNHLFKVIKVDRQKGKVVLRYENKKVMKGG